MRSGRLLTAALVTLTTSGIPCASAAAPVAVTACGQAVFGDAALTADLNCSGMLGPAVTLVRSGTLSLNGFTITESSTAYAVECLHNCSLEGPGLISGGAFGVTATRRIAVAGVDFENSNNEAVSSGRGGIRVANSTITTTGRGAVQAPKRIILENVTITGAGDSITSFAAVQGRSVELINSSVTGCNYSGVKANQLRATNTTISGNGTDAECGATLACSDIETVLRPSLSGSTCETSLVACKACGYSSPPPLTAETDPMSFNWGVCSLD